jgi:hypothetical protein
MASPVETGVISAGVTDVQVAGIRCGDGFAARLSLIQVGPRGGITFATADLSDDNRHALILLLGGVVSEEE